MGSVKRIFKKPSTPKADAHPIQKVAAAVDNPAINAMANVQKKDPSFLKKVEPAAKETKASAKDTLGASKKKKRRLRDGRRSLMSGSAMGVSDKLG